LRMVLYFLQARSIIPYERDSVNNFFKKILFCFDVKEKLPIRILFLENG